MTKDFGKLCEDILKLDPQIRFAGVCDDSGEIKFGGHREGINNLLSADETKRSNLQAFARWGLRNSLAPKIGRGKYAMAEYRKDQTYNSTIRKLSFTSNNNGGTSSIMSR